MGMEIPGSLFLEQILEPRPQIMGSFPVQGIVDPFSFFPAGDQPRVAQDFHMVGKGGLGQMEIFQQHAGAPFSSLEKFQDMQSVFVAQGFELSGCMG